jgi:hypothetical protein
VIPDRSKTIVQKDAVGPGLYHIKEAQPGPVFTFGSRFNSDIRSKEHLHPKKAEGPGPGDYQVPGSIRALHRSATSKQNCTFGNGKRQFSDLPQHNPAPNMYNPSLFEEMKMAERKGYLF